MPVLAARRARKAPTQRAVPVARLSASPAEVRNPLDTAPGFCGRLTCTACLVTSPDPNWPVRDLAARSSRRYPAIPSTAPAVSHTILRITIAPDPGQAVA
jgi:hypothetical protein